MAEEEIISGLGGMLPDFSGLASYIGLIIGIVILGLFLAVFAIWLINFIKFNKKIVVFRKVGNAIVPTLRDKAQFARVGNAGDYWCQLRKFKKILPRPRIQMEKNTFWYYERDDGEWINFSLKDFDSEMKKVGCYYVDEDMRLQRLGIQKNLRERFQKVTFWQRYGGMIISILFVLIVAISFIALFKSMEGAWTTAGDMAGAVKEMAIEVRNLRIASGSGALPI